MFISVVLVIIVFMAITNRRMIDRGAIISRLVS